MFMEYLTYIIITVKEFSSSQGQVVSDFPSYPNCRKYYLPTTMGKRHTNTVRISKRSLEWQTWGDKAVAVTLRQMEHRQ